MAFRSKTLSIIMVIVSVSVQLISVVDGKTSRNGNKEAQSSSVTNSHSLPDQPEPMWINASLAYEYALDQMLLSDRDVYLANRAGFDHSLMITPEHESEELLDIDLEIYYFLEMLIEDGGGTFCEQDGGIGFGLGYCPSIILMAAILQFSTLIKWQMKKCYSRIATAGLQNALLPVSLCWQDTGRYTSLIERILYL